MLQLAILLYMNEEALLRKILDEHHFKLTKPRLIVFRQLLHKEPLTITQIIDQTSHLINRVSVYRVVELYEALNIVRRVNIGWRYKVELSEIFSGHHHHITCISCGNVIAIEENKTLERIIQELGSKHGFRIQSHQIELMGYCPECK